MEIVIYFVQYILVFELKLLTHTTSIVTFTVIMILFVWDIGSLVLLVFLSIVRSMGFTLSKDATYKNC